MNYSPLRYPGGKSSIAPSVGKIITDLNIKNVVYIEPFAGGAGVALYLLMNKIVDRVVINDYDKAIYSFWRAVKEDHESLIKLIDHTPVTIEEWKKQKKIYAESNRYSVELGFAAFFLNRTNRSGILNAGPIGGLKQEGFYKIDARYNKEELINRIEAISKYRSHINVYNKEIRSFISSVIPKYEIKGTAFTYFDPPYYVKGQRLYKNFFRHEDHEEIAKLICKLKSRWIITYDNVDSLREIYKGFPQKEYSLNYSAAEHKQGAELLIAKDDSLISL